MNKVFKKLIRVKYLLKDAPLKSVKDLKKFLYIYLSFGYHQNHLKRKSISEIRKDKLVVLLSKNLPHSSINKNLIDNNDNKNIKVLFTINALNGIGGTEMWLSQIIEKLQSSGLRSLIYTPIKGNLYESLLQKKYQLTDSISEALNYAPSVIHLQHHNNPQITKLINLFDNKTPIFNLSHGIAPILELPYINQSRRIEYGAVSHLVASKIAFLLKKDINQIHLTKNFFTQQHISSVNKITTRNIAVVSTKTNKRSCDRLSTILKSLGYELSIYGDSPQSFIKDYRDVIDKHELFFATGKTAIDILGYGKKVLLFEGNLVGPAVLSSNVEFISNMNFALASPLVEAKDVFSENISAVIKEKIESLVNDDDTPRVDYLLKNNSIDVVSYQLIQIYNQLLSKR